MSSYATLRLRSLDLGVTRNEVDPGLMWLFRPHDKHVEKIDRDDRDRLAAYVRDEYIDDYDAEHPFIIIRYSCTAREARDRLDLKGYTFRVAKMAFESDLADAIHRAEDLAGRVPGLLEDELDLLRSLTVDGWMVALSRILHEKLSTTSLDRLSDDDPQSQLLRYMLSESRDFYGCPGVEHRHFVRLLVESVPPNEQVVYDLTDLVQGGWVDAEDEFVSYAEALINEDFLLTQRIIVLTEGVTDRRLLARSLRLLYPHLVEYFHFFDFIGHKVGGGAGELANLVRAFAAADVRHRILALFDNDTAARSALINLDLNVLPRNMIVRYYPDIKIARNYPTLGPSGKTIMDVNHLACSLELYLGEDVLRGAEGELMPVQWTGYNQRLNAYQGEILDKKGVVAAFETKLTDCEDNPRRLASYDWDGIQSILSVMRSAFNSVDEEAILNAEWTTA